MKHLALSIVAVAVLAMPFGVVQAQTNANKPPAKKAATTKKAPAKKTVKKTSKGVPAKTAKAVESNTPVEPLSKRLSDAELAIAQRVYTGRIQCELGADITVTPDEKNPGFFNVSAGKQRYYMHPVESRTGAIRLEDGRAEAMMLQLGNKSMVMNQKLGQRVADDCQTSEQKQFAAQLERSGGPGLLDGSPKK
ncbi:hypothetical protein FVQ98_16140 [Ottowia sp. GY511]|uniref:Uncharacterized protein n=1 Tax=Ottowia flava TaxID=2675430 RepID=A0ABW4KXD5_9BURK|nr:hypothetical protein [Ottowia sp. GY511]TXK24802.1 hypothetical protein FVQ98_16140 [Ottowia sp. GY511]